MYRLAKELLDAIEQEHCRYPLPTYQARLNPRLQPACFPAVAGDAESQCTVHAEEFSGAHFLRKDGLKGLSAHWVASLHTYLVCVVCGTTDVQLYGGIRRPANLCGPFPVEKILLRAGALGVFRGWGARPLAE